MIEISGTIGNNSIKERAQTHQALLKMLAFLGERKVKWRFDKLSKLFYDAPSARWQHQSHKVNDMLPDET